jgi:dTMP kinase
MKLISFEGIEGVGKSTQINLLKDYLIDNGHSTEILREPGSTRTGEQIRDILLNSSELVSSETELLLMFAARAQLIHEKVSNSELDYILFDRFYDASIAYQGYGRGLSLDFIEKLINFTKCPEPNLTLLLDISVEEGFRRKTGDVKDRIESAGNDFFENVRKGYLEIAKSKYPRVRIINANMKINEIHKSILDALSTIL